MEPNALVRQVFLTWHRPRIRWPPASTAHLLLAQLVADEDSDICGRYVSEARSAPAPAPPHPLAEEDEEDESLEESGVADPTVMPS